MRKRHLVDLGAIHLGALTGPQIYLLDGNLRKIHRVDGVLQGFPGFRRQGVIEHFFLRGIRLSRAAGGRILRQGGVPHKEDHDRDQQDGTDGK